MDDVPLKSPDTLAVSDDEDDLLTQIEDLLSDAPSPPTTHHKVRSPDYAETGDIGTANLSGNVVVSALKSLQPSSPKQLRWRDDTSETSVELEDVRAFDKHEPVEDVSTTARDQFEYVLVERTKANKNIRRLYISHALSAWGDRMWEFAIALLLINIWPDSLLLVALFGFTEAISVVVAGPLIGDWVDTSERLSVVRFSLFLGNGMVVLSAGIIAALLRHETVHDAKFWALVALLLIGGSATKLASVATTLAVEKEWVKLICGDDTDLLASTNAGMRRIDLLCKLLAPICVGVAMTALSPLAGAVLIGGWHCVLLGPEYIILTWVYQSFTVLRKRKTRRTGSAAAGRQPRKALLERLTKTLRTLRDGWGDYKSMEIFRPALALALLYCTVLSFGSLFTAYAYHRGVNEAWLAGARGIGAACGLLGTFAYPPLHRRYGATRTGGLSIWLQLGLLSLCLIATMVGRPSEGDCSTSTDPDCQPRRHAELILLLLGVITSRFGLWMFDLSVSQMLQERVPLAALATVNGTQSSMQELLDLLGYALGLLLHRPDQFFTLVYISFGFVAVATLLYTAFLRDDEYDDLHRGTSGSYSPVGFSKKKKKKKKKRKGGGGGGKSKRKPKGDLDESLLDAPIVIDSGEQFTMTARIEDDDPAMCGVVDDDEPVGVPTTGVSSL